MCNSPISVIGEFNSWHPDSHQLFVRLDHSGIWECFFPDIKHGDLYKYQITSRYNQYQVAKADPFGFLAETPPNTASIVWDTAYEWKDKTWLQNRMASAKKLGIKYMYIETMHELNFAISMYKKNGFHNLDKPLGESGHTGCDIWMKRKIIK